VGAGISAVHCRRTDRLLRPTTALFVVLPVVTVVTVAAGVDRKLLGTAVWLASIPLWFLAAYLALVALTPWLHALHRRAGLAVPAVLVGLVAVADLLRMGLDVPIVGESSYLFAWLAVYQLGFCWRDGLLRLGRGQALAVAAGGLVALIGLTVLGPYNLAMVGYNTNPPTLALMALAATQVGVVLALQPAANRWLRRTRPWTAVVASNAVVLIRGAAAVASAVDGVLRRRPRRPGRPLRPDRTAPVGAASCRARAVARRRDRGRIGRRAGRTTRRCRVRPRLPWPHRAPMGAVVSYLSGAAVLRVVRTQPVRSAVTR
jgi:hypothetical protein